MWKNDELGFSVAFFGVEFFCPKIGSLFKFNANECSVKWPVFPGKQKRLFQSFRFSNFKFCHISGYV